MTTAYQGDKPYVFLSYSHKDEELALSVIEYLQEHSFNVWYDEGIHSGTQWKDVILKKIANPNCWMMVFLVTQNSLASKECRREIVFADKKEKKFLNVVIGSPKFPDWFICDFDEYQRLDEEKFPNRKAMLDKLNSELIWHQRNTDKPTDTPKETPKETPKAKAPWVCKNCGSNNSGDDDVCEVCGSSDRYVAPKETPAPSSTEGLKFTVTGGTATVTGYKGTDTKVIIPATIICDGKTYKVTSIGENAFCDCKNLTSITIPESVTFIGKSAFCDCTNLTSITIPDSVTSIGVNAFWGCSSLTSVTIPESVTSIGGNAFYGCTSLTSIDVDKNNTHYKSIDGNLYTKDGSTLIQYAAGKTATSFTIPDHITSIVEYAFAYCENLTSITIPNSVTSIGESAFSECSSLTSITIPDSVTSIGKRAFALCLSLTSISIPNSVTTIGESVFFWCKNLTSISIPNSVITIGESVFFWCKNLTIYCEAKSKPEGWHTYWNPENRPVVWGCESSKRSVDPKGTLKLNTANGLQFTVTDGTATVSDYKGTDTKVIIPATIIRDGKTYKVTSIGERAFKDCTNLTSITIPNSVTSIGVRAFWGCSSLISITIPNSVTTIGEDAFFDCKNLTAVSIPNSVTSIGESAFSWCENITSITIPDSVTSIGDGAFRGCFSLTIYCKAKSKPEGWDSDWNPDNRPVVWGYGSSSPKEDEVCESSKPSTDSTTTPKPSPTEGLEFSIVDGTARVDRYKGTDSKVIIPATITRDGKTYKVTAIGEKAFYDCKNLTAVSIPDSVTSIGESAFSYCTNLTSITIPDGVTSIGEWAFHDCKNLTAVSIPNSVTSIGVRAFVGCTSLTSITIPDGVTSISDNAFEWCENLTSITIPNSVTSIGEDAFFRCSSLTSITIPNSVISIGKSAFDCCKNLTSITIPNRVTSIGSFAFSWCTKLTSITIPNSVTSIGHYAFYKCKNLTIYCEAKSKPEGWHAKWKPRFRPVVWGRKIK